MKRMVAVLSIVMLVSMAGIAMAVDTTTVAVTATVVGTCVFNSAGSVTFTLDQGVGGDVNGIVVQPTFTCTLNTPYTIADDDGLNESGPAARRLLHALVPATFIPYSFSYTAAGIATGALQTMDIASTVLDADYATAPGGNYGDTVTLTINP